MSTDERKGRIVTFYSYKGGTGRSMALANMAWILASNGKRVLMVDWDLEAPGLHRYFHPFLAGHDLSASKGVIDFVVDFASETMTPAEPGVQPAADWYVPHANILRYAFSLDWKFPGSGTLDLVPAGQQDSSYALKVNAFNWQNFYERLGGGAFLEAARQRMRQEYDYVLIDSRTGVSDTSGICTVQMPDVLVTCFTLNDQSIEGAAAVSQSVQQQRGAEPDQPGIKIFPVPTRVERAEKERLELALEVSKDRFENLLGHFDESARESYWGDVEIFYEPFYAYEEVLATFRDRPNQTSSLLASIERLTRYVTDGEVVQLEPPSEDERERVLLQYTRKRPARLRRKATEYLFYLSYARGNSDRLLDKLFFDLSDEVRLRTGTAAVGFVDKARIEVGDLWEETIRSALENSRVLVALISPSYVSSEYCGKEFQAFRLREADPSRTPNILPLVWIPLRGEWPSALSSIQMDNYGDTSRLYSEEGLRYLMGQKRYQDEYRALLSKLAGQLADLAENARSSLGKPLPPLSQVESAFGTSFVDPWG